MLESRFQLIFFFFLKLFEYTFSFLFSRNPGRKIPNRSGGASLRGGSHSPSNLNNSNQVLNNNNNGNSSNSSNSREVLCNTPQSKPCISLSASPATVPSTGSQQQQQPQVTTPPPPPPPSTTTATPTTSTQQPQLTSAASQQISSSQPQIVQPSHSNYSQQAQSREQQPPQPQSLPLQQPQVSKVNESPVVSPTLESIKVNGSKFVSFSLFLNKFLNITVHFF